MRNFCFTVAIIFAGAALGAGELYVDVVSGKEGAPGTRSAPCAAVAEALTLARPGDTVFILPAGRPIRGGIAVRDLRGSAERPIVIDGMNNIFLGTAPLRTGEWKQKSPGLYSREKVTAWSWIDRYFMTLNGRIVRMGRVQKGSSQGAKFKKPEELAPGEWTVVRHEEVRRRGIYRWYRYEFFLRLPEGATSIESSGLEEPAEGPREGGVALRGKCRHLEFRNIIAKNFHNDGFNLHGDCRNICFENIAAVDCGDDGISAHETCEYSGKNMVFIGCATAICHIQKAESFQENVYAEKIVGREFYFMNNTRNTIRNAFVLASSQSGSRWSVRKGESQRAVLENVHMLCVNPRARFVKGVKGELEFRAKNVRLAGFREVMKAPGIAAGDPEELRKRIAAERIKLFSRFGGNLEKALE